MPEDELLIAGRLEEVKTVRAWADGFADRHGLAQAVRDGLQVSLDEVLSNIIAYGYADMAEHEILVRLAIVGGTLIAEIEDDGLPFDPTRAPAPDLSGDIAQRKVGGLGIHLVRSLNGKMSYERVGGKNRLRLENAVGPADDDTTKGESVP